MRYTLYFLIVLFTVSSCASSRQSKWLESHKSSLSQTALSGLSTDEKVDVMMESYALMMHQSLDFVNPKKGIAFAEKYNEDNKDVIMSILEEANKNYATLSKTQKVAKGISLMSKSYAKDFVDLFPRFKRKYNLLNKVTDVNEKIKEAILSKLGL